MVLEIIFQCRCGITRTSVLEWRLTMAKVVNEEELIAKQNKEYEEDRAYRLEESEIKEAAVKTKVGVHKGLIIQADSGRYWRYTKTRYFWGWYPLNSFSTFWYKLIGDIK